MMEHVVSSCRVKGVDCNFGVLALQMEECRTEAERAGLELTVASERFWKKGDICIGTGALSAPQAILWCRFDSTWVCNIK